MKMTYQLGFVLAVCFLGEYISSLLPFTFPSSVTSMILLFVLLIIGIIESDSIKHFTDFLLSNMSFFFIPAGVAIMDKFDILKANLLPIIIICIVSTLVTFFATALAVNIVTPRKPVNK